MCDFAWCSSSTPKVNMAGDWLCHSCGVNVDGKLSECHMCNAVRPGETDWICTVCTFVNDEDDAVCQMCLSEKPVEMGMGSIQSEKTWSCESCGYHNTKTQCCRMCGFIQGNEVTARHRKDAHDDEEDEEDDAKIANAETMLSQDDGDDDEETKEEAQRGGSGGPTG